jgi:fluoride ion exporter CrcB/FEX
MSDPNDLTPDQLAAHELLTELRTRITTQTLPYQYGIEASALESIYTVFEFARASIKKYPGCEKFASLVTNTLNQELRPLTAKWHRPYEEGQLNSRDGADEFRADLEVLQGKLQSFTDQLHQLAYGTPLTDRQTPAPFDSASLAPLFDNLPFGIHQELGKLDADTIAAINDDEKREINERRGKPAPHTQEVTNAMDDEKREINERRGKPTPHTQEVTNAVGLALSGGGIRSATFGLGVVQVLAQRGLLKQVDILSTVSGGGYTGSFLTRRLGEGTDFTEVAWPHGPDPEPIRFIRQNAKFLAARNTRENWETIATTIAGMVLNWTAPLFVIALLSIVAVLLSQFGTDSKVLSFPVIFPVLASLTGLAFVAYGWSIRRSGISPKMAGQALWWLTLLTSACGALWLVKAGHDGLANFDAHSWKITGLAGALGVLTTIAPSIVEFLPLLKTPKFKTIASKLVLVLAGLIVPAIALAAFYIFWLLGEPAFETGFWFLAGIAGGLGFIAFFVLDVNLTAPHRFYRDKLARTFIHKTDDETTAVELTKINPSKKAPYHLINTTVNLPTSESPALRDRRSDFFLFSKHWIGSTATGYAKTDQWRASGNPVDLATAMAVSGAALSSHMGLGSKPFLRPILTLLNLRLGYWIKKPDNGAGEQHPGFRCLIREMIASSMSEKEDWFNLSDGGHIENMAVYELLRRRAKYIICVDGEADPNVAFEGLLTLVRHAQIDFGVEIKPELSGFRPDFKTSLSNTHSHLCRIRYPGPTPDTTEGWGLLLYIKLSVTGNESELIKRYRSNNPEFPYQTTLDQFFDEEQFEAYRQLGVHVAEGLFSKALLNNGPCPTSIEDWFRQLAQNLLLPE